MTRGRRILVAVLALLVAAAAVLTWRLAEREPAAAVQPALAEDGTYTVGSVAGEPRAAVQAAVEVVPLALSYDYRDLERTVTSAASRMTVEFAAEFRTTFEATVRPLATTKQAVSQARVRAAGIVSHTDDRVVCLLYVDQVLVGSKDLAADDPVKVGQTRVTVQLVRVGGSWKVDDLQPL
ncbi:MAG: hypothetical protein WC642_08130 [Nocardioides sp.]|jgi:Mce-associated membrane protein